MNTYRKCSCGLPIHNKKEKQCVACLRDAEFERLARVHADPWDSAYEGYAIPLKNGFKKGFNYTED
jgi:hypothetical protein